MQKLDETDDGNVMLFIILENLAEIIRVIKLEIQSKAVHVYQRILKVWFQLTYLLSTDPAIKPAITISANKGLRLCDIKAARGPKTITRRRRLAGFASRIGVSSDSS